MGRGVGGRQYLKQIKYQMLVVVDSNHILQMYNPAIFYCHRTSPCLLAIFKIKYQMLVVVHPQSDKNVRLQWGF